MLRYNSARGGWTSKPPPGQKKRQEEEAGERGATAWDAKLLPLVERLVAAGYRPSVYESVSVRTRGSAARMLEGFDPAEVDTSLEVEGRGR